MSAFAQWLNTAFAGFDLAILQFYHDLAVAADPVVRPIMHFFSFIGDDGIFCFFLAAIFFLFPRTRRAGVALLIAIAIGAIFTNLTLKELIARPRPFNYDATFRSWWEYVGAPAQGELSFPSGHVTSAAACMTAVCLSLRKKWYVICPAVLYVLIMCAARNYLMVHYPTDVIGGIFVGALAGVIAFFLIRALWRYMEKHTDKAFCRFVICADIRNISKKKTVEE